MLHDLVASYGPLLVFINVLAASLGLPVPALPTLIFVGASIAMAPGEIWSSLLLALATSVAASLLGDTVWFKAGRRYGGKTLQTLCKVSLSRDTCVKQTERFFGRWGARVLFVAKFIPGLSMVSVPLAGAMGVRYATFLQYDGVGAGLWAAAGLALGAVFAYQLDLLFAVLGLYGRDAAATAGVLLVLYIGYRWYSRRALAKKLETARMTVDQLHTLMQAGDMPLVFDIRSPEKRFLDPVIIPGAQFADERDLGGLVGSLKREQKIVIYCSCPNEVSAAWMAKHLRELGFPGAMPLLGGLDAWRDEGWALESIADPGELDAHGSLDTSSRASRRVAADGSGDVCAFTPPPMPSVAPSIATPSAVPPPAPLDARSGPEATELGEA
jgi:membrane protein DedA with SNARE-associated domain/rhodanese-related sulfurtransferase